MRTEWTPEQVSAVEPLDFSHGGYYIGEEILWENPMGIDKHPGTIVALHRNGNLLIREPKFGTTVDVHHTHVQRL